MEKKAWCGIGLAATTVVSLVLYLLYLIFKTLASLLTSYGATAVFLIFMIFIVRYVIRVLVFPGSSIFIRKMIEYNIRKNMTKIIINTVGDFKYNLEDASQSDVIEDNTVDLLIEGVVNMK